MKRGYSIVISFIDVKLISEVNQSRNFIILCSQVQRIEFIIVVYFYIWSFVYQYVYNLWFAIICGIEHRSETLHISLIHPFDYLFLRRCFILFLYLSDKSVRVLEIQLYQLFFIVNGKKMQNVIFIMKDVFSWIYLFIIIQKLVNFESVMFFSHKFVNILFLHVYLSIKIKKWYTSKYFIFLSCTLLIITDMLHCWLK